MSPTLSRSPLAGVDVQARPRAALRNPALRGPIVLATDGTSQSGAAVVAARLLSEQLGVPLEVVTVLEPDLAYGVALGGTPLHLPDVDEARRAQPAARARPRHRAFRYRARLGRQRPQRHHLPT